jgi:GntR family transcriptional regulator of gluconate operon
MMVGKKMLNTKTDRFARSLFSKNILEELRLDIVSGRLPADSPMVESQLASQFGVSRGPIRTALHALEQEGLVQTMPNGRVQVVGFSTKCALELFEIRQFLEKLAARYITESPTVSTGPLLAIVDSMLKEHEDRKRLTMLDIDFHRQFVKMSDNWALMQAWHTLIPVVSAVLTITNSQFEDFNFIIDVHLSLVNALEKRDLSLAVTLIEKQFDTTMGVIIEHLKKVH